MVQQRNDPWAGIVDVRGQPTFGYLRSVEFHADMRLENVGKVLHVVAWLRERGAILPADPVTIPAGGAQVQMGEDGSLIDRTAAAHKLPCPIAVRGQTLDLLVPADEDLMRLSVQGWFATTTRAPLYVNACDSLWERKGLREAFRLGVQEVVHADVPATDPSARQRAVQAGFDVFRACAREALARARLHNGQKLELQSRSGQDASSSDPRALTVHDRRLMAEVLETYGKVLDVHAAAVPVQVLAAAG